jgi:ketosteroid isomerase-like protein
VNDPEKAAVLRSAEIVLVTETIARLTHAADHGTLEEYGELLDPDVVWEMSGNPATGLAPQVRRGREEVLAGAVQRRADGIQGPGTASRHVVTNTAVDQRGDVASAVSYWRFYRQTLGTPRLASAGVYHDTFLRSRDGGWRLARRRILLG